MVERPLYAAHDYKHHEVGTRYLIQGVGPGHKHWADIANSETESVAQAFAWQAQATRDYPTSAWRVVKVEVSVVEGVPVITTPSPPSYDLSKRMVDRVVSNMSHSVEYADISTPPSYRIGGQGREQGRSFADRFLVEMADPKKAITEAAIRHAMHNTDDTADRLEECVGRIVRDECVRLETELEAIPVEERDQYEVRDRRHADGWSTRTIERKDAPCLPCECERCRPGLG